jgi:hypothetical protein
LRGVLESFGAPLQFRRWSRTRVGTALVGSRAYRSARDVRRRLAVAGSRIRSPDFAGSIDTCFFFVGHTKSGGSLLGSLLDAHPDIVCSDELGLAQLIADGIQPNDAFRLAARNARREAGKGRITARRVEPYSLAVPGQSQGVADHPVAVGDSRAGPTTRFLASRPDALDELRRRLSPIGLQVVQVVRNPFDPIAVMVVRGRRTVEDATRDYREQCERVVALRSRLDREQSQVVRYEDFVDDPRSVLIDLCESLGVEATSGYLDACAGVVDATPRLDRNRISWDSAAVAAVESVIAEFPFLAGYAFESA